jgi:hypothetical protein
VNGCRKTITFRSQQALWIWDDARKPLRRIPNDFLERWQQGGFFKGTKIFKLTGTLFTQALVPQLFLFVDLFPARNLICAAIANFSGWLQGSVPDEVCQRVPHNLRPE